MWTRDMMTPTTRCNYTVAMITGPRYALFCLPNIYYYYYCLL